jgi:hypothetical protein
MPSVKVSQRIYVLSCTFIVISAVAFWTVLLPAAKCFPWSDEWIYLPAVDLRGRSLIKWLFEQHNDHRLPLQKALHLWLLRAGRYDFRVLVAVNYLFACVAALLALRIARLHGGYLTIGDLALPLVALNVGAGCTQWGFHFQFLSSTLFLLGFVALAVSFERNDRPADLVFALMTLSCCALCGLNGLIDATVLTGILCALFGWELWWRMPRRSFAVYFFVAVCALESMTLWALWTPSGASKAGTLTAAAEFFRGMVTSSLVVYAHSDGYGWWKFALITLQSMSDIALTGAVAATGVLMLVTAVGRSRINAWVPGSEMHYGYSTIAAPIAAWVLLSRRLARRWRIVTGVVLLALFARAYQTNWKWRWDYAQASGGHVAAVQAKLANARDIHALVESNIMDFFYVDDPSVRSTVESGIATLRREGGYLYRPQE